MPLEDPHLVLPSRHVERIAGRRGDLLVGEPSHVVIDPDAEVFAANLPGRSVRHRQFVHARPRRRGLALPAEVRQLAAAGEPADAADVKIMQPALAATPVVPAELSRCLIFDHLKNCRFVSTPFGAYARIQIEINH